MKRFQNHFFRLTAIGLLGATLAGCVAVPYESPGYYGYQPAYVAPVVTVPVYGSWHHHHHHHRW